MEQVKHSFRLFTAFEFLDIVDIALLTIVFFSIYQFIKERRAGKLALGVGLLFVFLIVCVKLDLSAMKFLLENLFQSGIIVLAIIFQPELRSALEKMGAQPLKGLKSIGEKDTTSTEHMIDEVADAVWDMSRSKTGALMVFERTTMLGDLGIMGTVIDAEPTSFLIKNIFFNKAPLHDGAVIVRNNRL